MTKEEAIEALKQGHKVRHYCFEDEEWVQMQGVDIVTQDGFRYTKESFWRDRQSDVWNNNWDISKG